MGDLSVAAAPAFFGSTFPGWLPPDGTAQMGDLSVAAAPRSAWLLRLSSIGLGLLSSWLGLGLAQARLPTSALAGWPGMLGLPWTPRRGELPPERPGWARSGVCRGLDMVLQELWVHREKIRHSVIGASHLGRWCDCWTLSPVHPSACTSRVLFFFEAPLGLPMSECAISCNGW